MLLVYHFDKNDALNEDFFNETMRLELGFFPKRNTKAILKMVGFSNDLEGGIVFLNFPDLTSQSIEHEVSDYVDEWEIPGVALSTDHGGFSPGAVFYDGGSGRFSNTSECRALNLELGELDTQKDFFSVKVNSRRASKDQFEDRVNLNNISIVIEIHEAGMET